MNQNIFKNKGVFSENGKNKLSNDMYYTPDFLVEYCVNKVYKNKRC